MSVWITFDTSKIEGLDLEEWEKQIDRAYELAIEYMKESLIVTFKLTNAPPPKRQYPIDFKRASDLE